MLGRSKLGFVRVLTGLVLHEWFCNVRVESQLFALSLY